MLISGVAAFILLGVCSAQNNEEFTSWMDDEAFHQWRVSNLNDQPFYLTAIEGRLQGESKVWRVKIEPKPQHVNFTWKWFSQLDENTYQDFCNRIVYQEGYRQIWSQSFFDTEGKQRYQVVFIHSNSPK